MNCQIETWNFAAIIESLNIYINNFFYSIPKNISRYKVD